jgi:phospholipid-transporting ATPase
MISAANVGVGIKGLEGSQAARASDYAICEFSHLKRLLLFHGRESYRKNSQMILYNFYKNVLLVLPQFWFGFQNGFSALFIYDTWIF